MYYLKKCDIFPRDDSLRKKVLEKSSTLGPNFKGGKLFLRQTFSAIQYISVSLARKNFQKLDSMFTSYSQNPIIFSESHCLLEEL